MHAPYYLDVTFLCDHSSRHHNISLFFVQFTQVNMSSLSGILVMVSNEENGGEKKTLVSS